jgi:hypothetical protein
MRGATVTHLPPTEGLTVDQHNERFRHGRCDGFTDWWEEKEYSPKATDKEYAQGYAVGWEMASDPLHEDGYDPQVRPRQPTSSGHRLPIGHRRTIASTRRFLAQK